MDLRHPPGAQGSDHPHNLPQQLTPLIGREEDLKEMARLLNEPACRLLTLVGMGGIGKTRLGLQIASQFLPKFPDGAWLVELGPLSDPELVPKATASALGLAELPGQPLLEALIAYLERSHLLLMLDNCEHLLDACARLVHLLLAFCPNVCIVVTSREPLHIAGEVVWPVTPLSLPDPEHLPPPEQLLRYGSVQLFVERARSIFPSFSVTPHNAPAIAQVCRRLDGLPLAIELAAARVKVLSVAQIAERLDHRFQLLTDGDRTAPARHSTLKAALDWSYDLLPEEGQRLFRRLTVFAGGFGLGATEAVCSGDGLDPTHIVDLLSRLVDRSLVVAERYGGPGRRYHLLETVRHYGREKSWASGEQHTLADRHLAWYLALAEQARPYLWGMGETAWLQSLEAEQGNLRAAVQWSMESGRVEESLRLATALVWYWYVRAHLHEGRYWLEQVLATSQGASPSFRARALNAAGALAIMQGEREQAAALLREAISLDCEQQCSSTAAWSLQELGQVALYGGHYARAEELFSESMALFREEGDNAGISSLPLYLGMAAFHQGDHGRAAALLEESLPLLQGLGDGIAVARALRYLGMIARHQGDLDRAQDRFEQALEAAWAQAARLELAPCLDGLAGVACAQGHAEHAARLFGAAEALRQALGTDLPPGIRVDHDQDLASTRARLGDEAFTTAWTAGTALSGEEAAVLALLESGRAEPAESRIRVAGSSRSFTPLQAAKRQYAGLTARERQVAALIAHGKSNAEIADELVVTVRTVEAHVTHILDKLGFSSRAQVAGWAIDRGLSRAPRTLEEQIRQT